MSIKVMSWVWDYSETKTAKRLALLALADNADDYGVCYPGVEYIANKCRITTRYAQKILQGLVADGELLIDYNNGVKTKSGFTNRYYIVGYCQTHGYFLPEGVSYSSPDGVSYSSPDGVSYSSPKPSVEPSVEPLHPQPPAVDCTSGTTQMGLFVGDDAPTQDKKKAVPKQQDRLFNGIAYLCFGIALDDNKCLVKAVSKQAASRIGKIKKYMVEQAGTPEQLHTFATWYKQTNPGTSLPRDVGKFATHWEAWQASLIIPEATPTFGNLMDLL